MSDRLPELFDHELAILHRFENTPAAPEQLENDAERLRDAARLEQLRAVRDRRWSRVCRVDSTRWDLTAFERADDELRRECRRFAVAYVPVQL